MASKSDFPALRVRIEGGRLVPASTFDQERVDSYKPGTTVMVKFTEEKSRAGIRKWHAIIGLVMKQCQTPWKNRTECHEAVKLALGIVNLGKSATGKMMQWPKSLSDLDDPELDDAVEQMIDLLSRITGVDVSTLKKETAHIGADDDKPPEKPVESDCVDQAPPAPEEPTTAPDTQAQAKEPTLTEDERKFLAEFASKMLVTANNETLADDVRAGIILDAELNWREACANHLWRHLGQISKGAIAVSDGKRTPEQYVQHFAKTLGVAADMIEGK